LWWDPQGSRPTDVPPASITGNITIAKMLTDLTKLYSSDDLKFGGDFYDVLDAKLKISYD
jgi:hypothetical protein